MNESQRCEFVSLTPLCVIFVSFINKMGAVSAPSSKRIAIAYVLRIALPWVI
jgi:hypothetical protein